MVDHLGHFSLYLIKESTALREAGGLPAFMHTFLAEAFALARAHVRSRNGNALVCMDVCDMVLMVNPAKNQGQCLLSLVGDVVRARHAAEQPGAGAGGGGGSSSGHGSGHGSISGPTAHGHGLMHLAEFGGGGSQPVSAAPSASRLPRADRFAVFDGMAGSPRESQTWLSPVAAAAARPGSPSFPGHRQSSQV